MPLSIAEQADQLNEHIHILLNTTQHLDDKFRTQLHKVAFKMREFITDYHTHFALSVSEYASYLNHDALSPLTIVLGYAELYRSIHADLLTSEQITLLNRVCDMSHTLIENLRNERKLMLAKRRQISSI